MLKSRERMLGGRGPPIRRSSVAYAAHVAASPEGLVRSFEEGGIRRLWYGAQAKWTKAVVVESSFSHASVWRAEGEIRGSKSAPAAADGT